MAQVYRRVRERMMTRSMRQFRRVRQVVIAALSAVLVMVALMAGVPSPATAAASAPPMPNDRSVPVVPVASHYQQSKPSPQWQPAPVSWPSGNADVSLITTAATPAMPAGAIAAPHMVTKPVQAGTLPVWVSPAASATSKSTPSAGQLATAPPSASPASAAPAKVHVSVAPRAATTAAGITGTMIGVQRADGATTAGSVQVSVGYGPFKDAFGGDWAFRLHVVTLPGCVLTTPDKPACRTETPVPFTRDGTTSQLTTTLTLPGASHVTGTTADDAAAPTVVLAATSSTSGSGGNYSATSLKPSGAWQAGGATDSFTYSYPVTVPAVPGGLAPQVQLSYDSQSVDGATSSTNNQPSWIGDGWDYSPGYVERSFQSCSQNPAGPSSTGDNCWSANNTLTLSLNGKTTSLIYDDATSTYHAQADSDEQIVDATGAANGAQNGEYFVVTTDNGTHYYFGRNQLPGFDTGGRTNDPATNSVWTEPVYFTSPVAGQNCYNTVFANSSCTEAYRWNLDYVVDTHSNVVSYFYNTETNSYAADSTAANPNPTATATYTRGGYLVKIQYGQRDGAVYSSQPAAQVVFDSSGRCETGPCDPSTISSSTSANWPDIPADLICAANTPCSVTSPSFWSDDMLNTIETDVLVGTTETPVDSWQLTHSFPATNDTTTPALWLNSIQHTGMDTTAGSSSSLQLAPVNFLGANLTNRVNVGNNVPITRQRLFQVTTETGEIIRVTYTGPACGAGTPDPSQNTALCYPDYWAPEIGGAPTLDWFNKFIVHEVTEIDPTDGGGADTIQTTYNPVGLPAWHYNDDPLTPSNQRTWDDWRGYQGMSVTTGTGTDPQANTVYTYFRGMDSDTTSGGGTATVTVPDSRDDTTPDLAQYEGQIYETQVYNGSSIVTDTITDPWTSAATATHAVTGLPSEQAFYTGTADTRVYTPLANGTTRETETSNTYDSYGRVTQVNDQGDLSTTADDLCTTTTYNDNTSYNASTNTGEWILDTPSEVKTVSVNCATQTVPLTDVVSDQTTDYDGAALATTPPTVGDATTVEKLVSYTGSTPKWSTESQTVDEYGRVLTDINPDTYTTRTAYSPATGAEPTITTVTDPMGHVTTTTTDPLRDLPLTSTDAAGYVTKEQYDALGRLSTVTKPGMDVPTDKYTYTVSNSGPSIVDSYSLNEDGSYLLSETLYDSLLRARETQTETPENGRDIVDTDYNTDGWESRVTAPYFNGSPVSSTYVQAIDGNIPSETGYTYDGAGRKTAALAYTNNTPTSETVSWQTTYVYGGDFTTTIPPAGGTASTTITDARGNTTDLVQYHSGVATDPSDPAADYSDTHYTYTPAGKQATVVDAAGNTWAYTYDLLGDQTSASDPDVGTSVNTYDNAAQLIATTDAKNHQTSIKYDKDGRKTATYDTTGGAAESATTELAAWTYDTVTEPFSGKKAVGYPATTTTYNGGDIYTQTINSYNSLGDTQKTTATLTGEDAALVPSGGYAQGYDYSDTGYPVDINDQTAIDGLPSEDVTTGYGSNSANPTSLTAGTNKTIAYAIGYTELGQVGQYSLQASPNDIYLDLTYDHQTQALTNISTVEAGQPTGTGTLDSLTYTYNGTGVSAGAGLLTSTTDAQNASTTVDTQCFAYDYAQRLAQAWTATDACAATPSTGNSPTVGGPQPYWQSWSYDPAGDRATQTDHDPAGVTSNDTTTTYHYPPAGSPTDQPHTLASTSATGPQAAQDTQSFSYDPDGSTTSITAGTNGSGDQTLTYNDQEKLTSDVTTAGNTTYVYDASGNLLVRRDPGTTTLFLGDMQLTENTGTSAGTLSGTRYYAVGGTVLAARTGSADPQDLIPDRQGTDQVSVNPDNDTVTRQQQFLPFGGARGTAPTSPWPGGDKGYVGGTPDPTTTLENLGAREYDPSTGRFLTADPDFEAGSPNQMGGYDYAGNNPTTGSDPTGLCVADAAADGVNCAGQPISTTGSGGSGPAPKTIDNTPLLPQTVKARVDTAIYEQLQDDIPKLQAFEHQLEQVSPNCTWGRSPRVMPGDKSVCDDNVSWQTLAIAAGATLGGVVCSLGGPVTDALCAMVAEDTVPGTAASIDTLLGSAGIASAGAIAGAAGVDELSTEISDAIGADQSEANALATCTNSFVGTTPVLMADGTTKPIDQVKVGDKITNAQPDSPIIQTDTVTAVHVTHTDHNYDQLTIATPTGPATITSTAEHLYWDTTTQTWTPADNLNTGDHLDTPGNGHATIIATRHYTAVNVTYNLTINNTHTYYVLAGDTPVLVHNSSCGPVIGSPADIADNLDSNTLFHYTNQEGFNAAVRDDGVVLRANPAGKVFATQEMQSPAEAEQYLFINNPAYAGKGDYVIVFRTPDGVDFMPGQQDNEVINRGTVRIPASDVIYAGPNPFQ